MTQYPVHYVVVRPARFTRLQLLLRLLAFCVLGRLGLSFGAVFLVVYLIGLQCWSIWLLAYQASLVDEYPPFSLAEAAPALPAARAL